MTRVFYCSTLFGAMTLAAALDVGHFGPRSERRLLIVSDNIKAPEAYPSMSEQPGFAAVRGRFDEVLSWNEFIAPLHPSGWTPRITELPLLSDLVMHRLGLDEPPAELVLESIAVPPSRTLAQLVRGCPITVYSDGLMSYGPTRDPLPPEVGARITRLLHLDLVPELTPLLLREYDVPAVALPEEAFAAVLASLPTSVGEPPAGGRCAMILGQYLSDIDLLEPDEEHELHARMLRALHAGGHDHVVFKAHPSAGRGHARRLQRVADELGISLTVAPELDPAEVCFREFRPELVVGCFSTALTTAAVFFDIPTATIGCELMLQRLVPYENSNRIPVTIIDKTVPLLRPDGEIEAPDTRDLQLLVNAVGFCMQSQTNPGLRSDAVTYLARHDHLRYFKKRRLEVLGLRPTPPRRTAPGSAGAAAARRAKALRSAAAGRLRRRIGG